MRTPDLDAVVLAGGLARRFGGADKPAAEVGGRPLIAWVADAVRAADRLVIVGPPRPGLPGARFVQEDPPGSGPVPALRAGLAEVHAPWLALLAADLPFLRAAHVAELRRAALGHGAGAVLVDDAGREQWLAGVWRAADLRDRLSAAGGAALRGVLGPLRPAKVRLAGGERPPWYDCDTPQSYERARTIAEA